MLDVDNFRNSIPLRQASKDPRSLKCKYPLGRNSAFIVAFCLIVTFAIATVFSIWVFIYFSDTLTKSKLLYSVVGRSFFADVYVCYPDGKLKTISPTANGIYYQPHINPQGNKVVFYGNEIGPPRIWIADLNTEQVQALTPETSGARHPVFSGDGKMIAFASDRADKYSHERLELMRGNGLPPKNLIVNLFTMDVTGRNVRQITFGPYQDQRPAFSPDGKILAFVSNRNGQRQLWTIRIDGTFEPKPLQKKGWGYRPWFSRDGQWIYFFTSVEQRHQICKISADGGPIIPLQNDNNGISHGPFFDTNNNLLLIHSTRNGIYGIWELPLDGGEPRQIVIPNFFEPTLHATRSRNGIISFDSYRQSFARKLASKVDHYIR